MKLLSNKSDVKSTIVGWVRATLGNASFVTSKFTAQSERFALTSQMRLSGLPLY